MSQGADDNHKSASHGSLGLRNEGLSGPSNEPVAAGEQYQSMDLSENNQYEWSDWFSKPKSLSAAKKPAPAEKPANGPAGATGPSTAGTAAEPIQLEPIQLEPIQPEPIQPEPARAEPAAAGLVRNGTMDQVLDEPLPDEAEREPVLDEPATDRPEPPRDRPEPAADRRGPTAGSAEGELTHPGPTTSRPVVAPPAGPLPLPLPLPLLDPSPTRPQRIVPSQARPQMPLPPAPRFIPAEGPPLPRRNRAGGAPPWVLPGAEGSRPQAADARRTRNTGPRLPGGEPPWPGRDIAEQGLSASVRTEDRPASMPAEGPARPKHAARAGAAAPADKAAPARKSRSAGKGTAGPAGQASQAATYKATEVVSGAETVMLPKQKPRQDAPDDRAAPVKKDASVKGRSTNKDGSPALTAIKPTTIMPVQKAAPLQVAEPDAPEQPYTPSQRRKWISRGVLLGILAVQAVFSLRLHNTAYLDEANYAFGGRLEIAHLFHGAAMPVDLNSTYSGSPVLYPVLSAWLNSIGGLVAARLFSLFEMLATTALLYAISRRFFNERVALCAALLFSAAEPTIFLSDFATFDASCLMLLALSAWIMVRTALFRWPVFLLAAPVAALAVATKYAGLLFVPSVAVLPALAGWPYHRRRVFAYPVVFGLAVAVILYGALRLAGPAYLHAVETTTIARAHGNTLIHTLLWQAVQWGGIIFGAALLGTVAYAWRPRTEPGEEISPAGSRLRRVVTGIVLTGSALLAPAYQAHLHTNESFQKHIGFGLFFAAPMAGVGLARIVGDHFRRPQLGIGIWGFAILLGMTQSAQLFASWANSQQFITTLTRQLKPGDHYLIEDAQVPDYYLHGKPGANTSQFHDTFSMVYNDKGTILTGNAGFQAAIEQGYFNVVAYNFAETASTDTVLANALESSSDYRLAAQVPGTTADRNWIYYIWVKKTPS